MAKSFNQCFDVAQQPYLILIRVGYTRIYACGTAVATTGVTPTPGALSRETLAAVAHGGNPQDRAADAYALALQRTASQEGADSLG
ncbi:MAG: hypothetical protein KME31_03025 [Tolypothrix carrinoi HA7290-LM1]|jgi:hypothetical protein|nr:hypothetical protein [Tolypothrix carrinoi HA7290-LM1]